MTTPEDAVRAVTRTIGDPGYDPIMAAMKRAEHCARLAQQHAVFLASQGKNGAGPAWVWAVNAWGAVAAQWQALAALAIEAEDRKARG